MTNSNSASGADKSPRILVADDTDVNQKIAKLILQRADYSVDIAADGQEAVEAHRQNPYDLILMDIKMPVMDGHEATQKIRELELKAQSSKLKGSESEDLSASSFEFSARAQRVPIIAMTGNVTSGIFDEKLYPGMNDCIGKPLQMDLLQSMVQKWINPSAPAQAVEKQAETLPKIENSHAKNEKPLDLDRAIEEFMGQKEILLNVLQKFLTSAGSKIDEIRQAVEHEDYGAVEAHAHAIKGAAANLTADRLADLAADLEQAADRQQSDQSTKLADSLAQEFLELKNYIQQLPGSDMPPAAQSDVGSATGPDAFGTG
jgi:CheY-like chemotaxis protein/HPt (histidine-containing phosphotransfer) domain-containing protein